MTQAASCFEREFSWLAELPSGGRLPVRAPVDPAGEWTQGWAVWELAPERRREVVTRVGSVVLRRTPLAGGRLRLAIRLWQEMLFGVVHSLEAAVRCRLDVTATPLQWWTRRTVRKLDEHRTPDELFGLEADGSREGDALALSTRGEERRLPVVADLTFDWGLFEAIPRLEGAMPEFTELRDFAVLRTEQELQPLGRAETPAGPLDGFLQLGTGGLPTSFWRGADRRLCYVRQGYRAFTSEPVVWEEQRT